MIVESHTEVKVLIQVHFMVRWYGAQLMEKENYLCFVFIDFQVPLLYRVKYFIYFNSFVI